MPEMLEIEMYRRGADPIIGRRIVAVDCPDDWYLKHTDAATVAEALVGADVTGTSRHGKLLLLETSKATCGLRFGMTGRLVVDGEPVIEKLEYSTSRLAPEWDRFGMDFGSAGSLRMNDPRRLGGVVLEPDVSTLGPDAWSIGSLEIAAILGRRATPLKALLLNQNHIAGLGNLLVDELLYRAGISPERKAGDVSAESRRELASALRPMLDELFERGGSHRGDLMSERHTDGRCPRDGESLRHATIGGRSTWWCPDHQR